MIKVLLISPTDTKKPKGLKLLVGGENTYTQTLLKSPPRDVVYTYHMDALKKGLIEYLPLHHLLKNLVKFRILPLSAGTEAIKVNDDFDLIHCHGYSVKIVGKKIPIVVSDSSSNFLFLRDYVKWPKWRIKMGYFMRRQLFRWLGIIDCDTNWQEAKKIVVLSKFAMKVHQKLGVPARKIDVVYPGIEESLHYSSNEMRSYLKNSNKYGSNKGKFSLRSNNNRKDLNILFVGIWFERKGGPLLLEAFKKLSGKYPNITLTIIGEVPKKLKVESGKLKVYNFVPREKLMREIFPKADIFVLVPPKAEGFGFAVLEAMSFGIPAVVTNVYALPELVEDGKTGYVIEPGNLEQIIEKLGLLIDNNGLREAMGEAAKKMFDQKFKIGIANGKLFEIYRQAVMT